MKMEQWPIADVKPHDNNQRQNNAATVGPGDRRLLETARHRLPLLEVFRPALLWLTKPIFEMRASWTFRSRPAGVGLLAPPEPRFGDAREMASALKEVGKLNGFRLVSNREATWKNIEYAITRWPPSVGRPGDTVRIDFAGHGVQIPKQSADRPAVT